MAAEFRRTHNMDVPSVSALPASDVRAMLHVPAAVSAPQPEWFGSVWLGDGSPPLVVDPIRMESWITDDSSRHQQSVLKSKAYDRAAVENLIGHEATLAGADPGNLIYYVPSLTDFNVDKLYPPPVAGGCLTYRGVRRSNKNFGPLPVITRLKYDGDLADKSIGEINEEMLQYSKTQDVRIYAQTGSLSQTR